MSLYKTVVADPPWPYSSPSAVIGNGGRGKEGANKILQVNHNNHYHSMSIVDIKSMCIESLCDDNAHLYLWTTNSFIVEAHDVAKSWGFTPKTIITWVKVQENGNPSMKTGYWFRSATEHVIFAVRGKLRLSDTSKGYPTVFLHHRLPHSQKPESFQDMVERVSPGPYLELFARRYRNGWDCWGDQL